MGQWRKCGGYGVSVSVGLGYSIVEWGLRWGGEGIWLVCVQVMVGSPQFRFTASHSDNVVVTRTHFTPTTS